MFKFDLFYLFSFDIIYLHSQQIEYRFNLKSKVCQKQAITRPWIDLGINKNATSLGESYIGSSAVPKASILSTIWRHEFTDSKGKKILFSILKIEFHYLFLKERVLFI